MIRIIEGIVGPKLARPLLIVLAVIAIVLLFNIAQCVWKGDVARQAGQTTRSGEAIAEAAQDAVATITNTAGREASVDAIVAGAVLEIDAAGTQEEKRAAAINAVCELPEYVGDPQCAK